MTISQLADMFGLGHQEALALAYMLEHEGYVSNAQLATAIGLDVEPLSVWRKSHTHLSVVIHRIRQKVPQGSVLNRRGFGFRVDADKLFGGDLV